MRKASIFLISILLVIALFGGFIYKTMNKSYTEIIDMNWSIKLSNSYKEVYSVDSGPSFHGDGERYHIFNYKNNDDIELSLKWKDDKNVAIESAIKHVLNTLSVPEKYMPNFKSKYKYYLKRKEDSSVIYLIFVPDTKRLYVIEDIF
ncbi:hypothetical protein [Thermoanaerobacterium thermosaccharolyticum]|uniref:hypothetical protein n=1 Tax=Thermoanaerobacterium thermosaccharolyticum TaxID=1517 RepID=UPI003DAA218D